METISSLKVTEEKEAIPASAKPSKLETPLLMLVSANCPMGNTTLRLQNQFEVTMHETRFPVNRATLR